MATIKYRDSKGVEHILNPYKVYNVIVNQEKGDSELDTISQKAISQYLDDLENKVNTLDGNVETKFENYLTKSEIESIHSDMKLTTTLEIEKAVKIEKERAYVFRSISVQFPRNEFRGT